MTIDSRNLVGAGLALAIIGLAAWGSSVLMQPNHNRVGTIEVRPLVYSVDGPSTATEAK